MRNVVLDHLRGTGHREDPCSYLQWRPVGEGLPGGLSSTPPCLTRRRTEEGPGQSLLSSAPAVLPPELPLCLHCLGPGLKQHQTCLYGTSKPIWEPDLLACPHSHPAGVLVPWARGSVEAQETKPGLQSSVAEAIWIGAGPLSRVCFSLFGFFLYDSHG